MAMSSNTGTDTGSRAESLFNTTQHKTSPMIEGLKQIQILKASPFPGIKATRMVKYKT